MLRWKDNTNNPLEGDVEAFRPFADRDLKSLLESRDCRLLVFPHSFQKSENTLESLHLFDLRRTVEGYVAQTGNLAGFVKMGDCPVAIRSRFATEGEEDFFLHYMLQKVFSFNLLSMKHPTAEVDVLDYLMLLFPYMLGKALSQGVYKEYCSNRYNNPNVRGVIELARHVRLNSPFKGCVAYRTREHSCDNKLTELIRHTIEYIRTRRLGNAILSNDPTTQANVQQIIQATTKYCKQERRQIIKANLKPSVHPYFTQYAPLRKLCLRILRHEQIKYGTAPDEIDGIVFDLSWLWEKYLGSLLFPLGFKHPDNRYRSGYLYLGYSETHNRNCFSRYPDFYDREEHGVVIDAKYKREIDRRGDLNQMITYLYRLKGRVAMLVMPSEKYQSTERYRLYGHGESDRAILEEVRIAIPQQAGNYCRFAEKIRESEKRVTEHVRQSVFQSESPMG